MGISVKEDMRMWTVQEMGAYQTLLQKGSLHGDWRRVERWWKPAYKWLCQQMDLRGIELRGRCPMWAWTRKPDFRSFYRGAAGVVRLELEVPDELVLVSHFGAWHWALNDCYFVTNDEELDKAYAHPCGFTREEVEKSWEKIFDLDYCFEQHSGDAFCQATFPIIELDYVRKTWEFPE
jgi:hypothetical protein